MTLHLEAMAAPKRKDAGTAKTKAAEMMARARPRTASFCPADLGLA